MKAPTECASFYEHLFVGDPYTDRIVPGRRCVCGQMDLNEGVMDLLAEQKHIGPETLAAYHSFMLRVPVP